MSTNLTQKLKNKLQPMINFIEHYKDIIGVILVIITFLITLFIFHFGIYGLILWPFITALFWWNIDSRLPILFALILLILIMVLSAIKQISFINADIKESFLENIAVWVYFFLVIGVFKQIIECKTEGNCSSDEEDNEDEKEVKSSKKKYASKKSK